MGWTTPVLVCSRSAFACFLTFILNTFRWSLRIEIHFAWTLLNSAIINVRNWWHPGKQQASKNRLQQTIRTRVVTVFSHLISILMHLSTVLQWSWFCHFCDIDLFNHAKALSHSGKTINMEMKFHITVKCESIWQWLLAICLTFVLYHHSSCQSFDSTFRLYFSHCVCIYPFWASKTMGFWIGWLANGLRTQKEWKNNCPSSHWPVSFCSNHTTLWRSLANNFG